MGMVGVDSGDYDISSGRIPTANGTFYVKKKGVPESEEIDIRANMRDIVSDIVKEVVTDRYTAQPK